MQKALDITMVRATASNVDEVITVVQDAVRRMQEKGITHWRLYLTDVGVRRVRERVAAAAGEEVYLARNDVGAAVGVLSVEWSDRACSPERGADGLAGYIHMLSVHRSAARTGLGGRMLRWCERLIASRGRGLVRLDCWAGSAFLPEFYEGLGYTRVGVFGGPNGTLLMEKRIDVARVSNPC